MRIPLCLLLAAGVFWSPLARARSLSDAADFVAKEMAEGLKKRGEDAPLLVVTPLRLPSGDAEAAKFQDAFTRALLDAGMKLVDEQSVKAAIREATLSEPSDSDLAELAGAFGAGAMTAGSVDAVGGSYMVNVRVVDVAKGESLVAAKTSFSVGGGDASREAKSLEAQLRRLSDKLAAGLDALEGDVRYQRFAIMPYEEVGVSTQDKELGLLVSAELTTLLQRKDYMIVERGQLSAIIDELALGQSGMLDPDKTAEVGKLAGAQALILGTVAEAGDHYRVNARVVTTADGQVVFADEVQLPAADLVALSSEAVVLRTRTGALYRSILLPGWGQLYNRQPVKAGLFAGGEVVSVGLAVTMYLVAEHWASRYDKLDGNAKPQKFDRFNERAESYKSWRNVFAYVAIGLHLANILDAYLSGITFDSATVGGVSASGFQF